MELELRARLVSENKRTGVIMIEIDGKPIPKEVRQVLQDFFPVTQDRIYRELLPIEALVHAEHQARLIRDTSREGDR